MARDDRLLQSAKALKALTPLLDAVAANPSQEIYLVGGAVRDLLLGEAPADIDVCVEGAIEPLLARLPGEIQVHGRFGTGTATDGRVRYDVAQTRAEVYPRPGALPQVRPADIASDLQRRDFTVNAIAMALRPGRTGEVISAVYALDHLKLRRLEVLHESSFIDDPTRLFRLARYGARLRFTTGAATRALAEAAVEGGAVATISGTRIGNELRLISAEADPVAALGQLAEMGIDRAIHPHFGLGPEHSDRAAFAQEALALLPEAGRRDLLVISACVLNVPPRQVKGLLDELAFTAADRDTIAQAAARSLELSTALRAVARPSEIAATIGNATAEEVALAGALGARQQAWEWLDRLRHLRLAIDGQDLIDAGVGEGPGVGAGLAAARSALLDGHATDRDMQLRIALDAARAA